MKDLKFVEDIVKEYMIKYRNPNLESFAISGLYDLFPYKEPKAVTEYKWDDVWPNCDHAGVYIFLDIDLNVLYIGKASKYIGERLGGWFKNANDKTCILRYNWIGEPRFVVTIAVPNDSKFENASLEEFLIEQVKPVNNTKCVKIR